MLNADCASANPLLLLLMPTSFSFSSMKKVHSSRLSVGAVVCCFVSFSVAGAFTPEVERGGAISVKPKARTVAVASALHVSSSEGTDGSDGGNNNYQQKQLLSDVAGKKKTRKKRRRRKGEPAGVECIFPQSLSDLPGKPLRRLRRFKRKRIDEADHGHLPIQHSHSLDTDSIWISSLTHRGVRDGEAQLYVEQSREEADEGEKSSPDVWQLEETKLAIRNGEYGWAIANEIEEARLAAMKLLLQDDFDRLDIDQQRIEAFQDVYGDLRLLRFLRKDKQQDAVSAATRYRAFIQWRMDNNVDSIRAAVERKLFEPPAKFDNIAQLVPSKLNFHNELASLLSTKDTVPAILYVGNWNTSQLTKKIRLGADNDGGIAMDDFLEYWIYIYESIHLYLYMESIARRHMVYVDEACDLTGMSLRQFSPVFVTTILKPWLRMTQLNYPETTRRIFFFNPPAIMNYAWNIVTPMASPGTVAKVRFCRGYEGSIEDFVLSGDMARMAQERGGKKKR